MAFTWTPISVNDLIRTQHINEIKNNLDTLFAWEGVSWNWQNLPVSSGQVIRDEVIQELREATDYADDNKCKTENSAFNSGAESGHNSNVKTADKINEINDYHSNHDNTNNRSVNGGN